MAYQDEYGYDGDPWGNQEQDNQSNPWVQPKQQDNTQWFDKLQGAYKQYLGREASQQELQDQFGGNYTQQQLNTVTGGLMGSQEAKDYAARQAQPQQQNNSGQGSQQPSNEWDTDGYAAPQYTAQPTSGPLAGYDANKWADPNHQTPKYVVGRIMASHDTRSPEGRQAIISQIQQAYPGTQFNGKDRINIPGLGEIDIFGGATNGEYRPQWFDVAADAREDAAMAAAGGGGFGGGSSNGGGYGYNSGSGSSSGSTTMTYTSGIAPPPGVSDELWAMLMQRAKQGTEVDRSDPNIRAQADAYSAQEERARRNYLADAAEGSSPYGTGAMAGMERVTAAQQGQRVGAMEAQLIGNEIKAKREEISHALSEMGDLLTDQQRMQLQKELAEMDNALERLRLDNQNAQYYAGLRQEDDQFGKTLAHRYWSDNLDNSYRTGVHRDQFGRQIQQDNAMWDWVQRGNNPF